LLRGAGRRLIHAQDLPLHPTATVRVPDARRPEDELKTAISALPAVARRMPIPPLQQNPQTFVAGEIFGNARFPRTFPKLHFHF
jgi:hypothetical protein